MNKIIEVALTGKFGAKEVTNLMEVICATPKPEMATEILLGIYEEPKLESVVANMNDGKEQTRTLVNADFWKDEVYYTYNTEKTKYIYIHKDTDRSLITPENYETYVLHYNDDNAVGYHLPMGEMVTQKGCCSIAQWQACSKPVEL